MKKIMADWANLPLELLLLIAIRIRFLDDYVNFGLVCKSWLENLKNNFKPSLYPYPMLMLIDNESGLREFYNPFNGGGIYKSRLPEICDKRCWGSSNGWLITLDDEHQIHLFNPLSRHQIQLPSLVSDPNKPMRFYSYNKIIVSSDSSSSSGGDFVVLAIHSNNARVASIKPGDETWMPLQFTQGETYIFLDTIYFGGKYYNIGMGYIAICNSNGLLCSYISLSITTPQTFTLLFVTYVVKFGGELYLINRSSSPDRRTFGRLRKENYRTHRFKVFKLDEENETAKEIRTLVNWSIFVGENNCFPISCIDYPECNSNCIYFTNHHLSPLLSNTSYNKAFDTGVFNLGDHTINPIHEEEFLNHNVCWVKPW